MTARYAAAAAASIGSAGSLPYAWLDQWRRRLDDVHDRPLEACATCCLGIGGTELPPPNAPPSA